MRYATATARYARLTHVAGALAFAFSYDETLIAAFKMAIPPDARRWEPVRKVWLVDSRYGSKCADLAATYLGVQVAVPSQSAMVVTETRLLRVEYVGRCKARDGGDASAFAHCNGAWSVIFPEPVLRSWFEAEPPRPGEQCTLYAVLMVAPEAEFDQIRANHRRLVKQWHPDISREPDAAEQFKAIQHAYEVLSDPKMRRKYDAGRALEASIGTQKSDHPIFAALSARYKAASGALLGYRSPLRCGWILCNGQESLGRFVVSDILQWEDVINEHGQALVTSWPAGAERFVESWQ